MTKASDAGLRTLPSPVGAGSYGALSRPLTCLSNACGIGGPCAPPMPAKNTPVAQLDRAPDYESRGQGFESLRARPKTLGIKRVLSSSGNLRADQTPFKHRPFSDIT